MKIRRLTRCLAAVLALGAAPASAFTMPADDGSRLEEAAQAYALCRQKLTAADELKIAEAYAAQNPSEPVGGLLRRMDEARGAMRVDRFSLGCKADPVKNAADSLQPRLANK